MLSQFSTKSTDALQTGLDRAGEVAVAALAHIAQDTELIGSFLTQTGLLPAQLRDAANNPAFLAGVLEFLCANETELLAFAANMGLSPQTVDQARQVLNGPEAEWSA